LGCGVNSQPRKVLEEIDVVQKSGAESIGCTGFVFADVVENDFEIN
jgi:hypothetical protein